MKSTLFLPYCAGTASLYDCADDTPFDPEKGAAGRGENPAVGDNPTA
jgi:hypothetical protein